jgi:AhpC/TSA family
MSPQRTNLGRVDGSTLWPTILGPIPFDKETSMRIRRPLIQLAVLALGLALAAPVLGLEVGDKAPDFALNGTDGKPVKLSDLTAKGPIVLYTFVAAFTPT